MEDEQEMVPIQVSLNKPAMLLPRGEQTDKQETCFVFPLHQKVLRAGTELGCQGGKLVLLLNLPGQVLPDSHSLRKQRSD